MTLLFIFILIIGGALAVYFAFRNDHRSVAFFLFADCVQNILAIIFYNFGVNETLITLFTLIKEIMVYLALLFVVFQKHFKKLGTTEFLILLYFLLIVVNAFRSSESLSTKILSARTLLLPIIFTYYGYFLPSNERNRNKIIDYIIKASLVLSVLAIVEYWCLGDPFWRTIGYTKYITSYRVGSAWTFNGVSINYYTWDYGFALRRFVSLMADPLASAYLIFLGFTLLSFGCKNDSIFSPGVLCFMSLFLLATSILSFSKGIYVCILVCFITLFLFKSRHRFNEFAFPVALTLFLIFVIVMCVGFSGRLESTSSGNHFNGLAIAMRSSGFFGHGLGSAGYNSAVNGSKVALGESYIGTILYQIGYLGLIVFCMIWLEIFKQLSYFWKTKKDSFAKHAIYILIAIFLCMLFSESSCSVSGTGIYFVLVGMALKKSIKKPKRVVINIRNNFYGFDKLTMK